MTPWIVEGGAAFEAPGAGAKARALARAQRGGLDVPRWFVLLESAFFESLGPGRRAPLPSDPPSLARIAATLSIDPAIRSAVAAAVQDLSPTGAPLAVRSSAHDEDGDQHSFAGQLESYLNVAPDDVPDCVVAVWRSAFSDRVLTYRRERGLPLAPRPPAVILQRMVAPRAAGVAFSADPVSGRRGVAVVSAVNGCGEALVSGRAEADTWSIARDGTILERAIARNGAPHQAPTLTGDEVRDVAALARCAARLFGRPQDIEWAIADRLVLLQSRPISSLHAVADPDACLAVWDNSNIVESYGGVTTPLTFSFAREIYPPVYRRFCRMMGVPERVIDRHDETFQNVLGLVRGRIYYNLLNWYRILALLPGYRLNRRFMEQMMGVEEPLSEELVEQAGRSAMAGRLVDIIRLTSTFAGLLASHITLERRIAAFYRRLDGALAPPCPALEDRRPDELAAHYRELRGRLLRNWDAPLVNDFFAMVFYGVLRRMVTRWCGDPGGTLQNDLIGGSGGMLSAEPAVLLRRLAELAAEHAKLLERLGTGTSDDILSDLQQYPELLRVCQTYLAKFGDRTFGELKLESAPLQDDPLPLFRAIGTLGRQIAAARASTDASAPNTADRVRAESRLRVSRALAGHPVRRLTFSWVLRHARRRIRDRENLRLERTRLFARIRQIFLELGRCLHAVDLLDDARDVMYLEVEEVLAFVDGRSTCTNLRALAALRRQEFRDFENTPAPASRFETRGPVYYGHDCQRVRPRAVETGEERRGLGCSAGLVRGPVRIVSDPRTVDLGGRWILVTAYTDPGWIMVFPAALGVLVERGSPLSHAAIVARELGIPAVVSVPGITAWVRDGDWIEMDGGTGVVRRITTPTEQNRLTGAAAPTVVAGRASVEGAVAHA